MTVLNLSQINDLCLELLVPRSGYNNQIFDFFTNAYNTGCRPSELFDGSLWSYDGIDTFTLQPLKGNNERYFNQSVLTGAFADRIISNQPTYYFTSLRKQRYYNEKFRSVGKIFNGTKEVENYLFRYRYVKQLEADGLTNLDIQAVMGWNNLDIVNNYTGAILYHH